MWPPRRGAARKGAARRRPQRGMDGFLAPPAPKPCRSFLILGFLNAGPRVYPLCAPPRTRSFSPITAVRRFGGEAAAVLASRQAGSGVVRALCCSDRTVEMETLAHELQQLQRRRELNSVAVLCRLRQQVGAPTPMEETIEAMRRIVAM